jgi:hypothetical protein
MQDRQRDTAPSAASGITARDDAEVADPQRGEDDEDEGSDPSQVHQRRVRVSAIQTALRTV